ncbi:MAG: divalent-cation tolerance protein CutA [Deltaproteobacteria bacterium]|nr:divalent-cation tolerance protein CutA [Deltaproteobacteria bacterium]
MTEYIQVSTTLATREDAGRLAGELVERRLAACAQILGPITSTFWWKEKVNEEEEWLLTIKSRKDLYERIEAVIKKLHPYEVPEIIATPITAGSREYLGWMDEDLV